MKPSLSHTHRRARTHTYTGHLADEKKKKPLPLPFMCACLVFSGIARGTRQGTASAWVEFTLA